MKKTFLLLVAFFLGIFSFYFLRQHTCKNQEKIIVCTTSIIADVVHSIVGDHIRVKTLMGCGVDPHIYRPRESDVQALSDADLIIYNGLHLEGKMADMFAHMRERVPTIAASDALEKKQFISSEFEGLYDPHIWHDVGLWAQTIPSITQAICKLDPDNCQVYQTNAHSYMKDLKALEQYVHDSIARIPSKKRELLTAHDAFNYFGRAYGFQVVGLQGISTDAVVSTHDIQQMADRIAAKKIPAIFLESSIPSKSIEAVQRAVASRGWQVSIAPELFSDSLGDKTTTADTYCGMIKHNVDVIVECLA
jgi:manganese/zinc/iron transport system substrate-binding protein